MEEKNGKLTGERERERERNLTMGEFKLNGKFM
jgi:hypothetical protein